MDARPFRPCADVGKRRNYYEIESNGLQRAYGDSRCQTNVPQCLAALAILLDTCRRILRTQLGIRSGYSEAHRDGEPSAVRHCRAVRAP